MVLLTTLTRFTLLALVSLGLPMLSNAETAKAVTVQKDISYLSPEEAKDPYRQERCVLDIHTPVGAKNLPVVVWFHGGGLTEGDKTTTPGELMQQGFVVVTPNYRLVPRGTPMNTVEDAAAAVAWVFTHIQNYGGNPKQIFLSGHSAGAYLSTLVTLDRSWLAARQIDAKRIAGLIAFSSRMVADKTFRDNPGTAPIESYAPLSHARADAPPILLL
ncbi:MAG: Carboxylesterase NlhH, partial [Verrucomicrobiota bacterium]